MAINWQEHLEQTKENFVFQSRMREALKGVTADIRGMRVLDYGAGAIPFPITQFSTLQKDQKETIAFDPDLKGSNTQGLEGLAPIEWTGQEPSGTFDLIVCHFSLHHLQEEPMLVVRRLLRYQPRVVYIADYDYTQADLKQFRQTFVSQQEQKELTALFGNDWQACFEYHRRLGRLATFQQALTGNGFRISAVEQGQGIARFKFFVIGKR